MNIKTVEMNKATSSIRLERAIAFLEAAEIVQEYWETDETVSVSQRTAVVGSLAVLSGIASGDAICGVRLGKRASDHEDAITLINKVNEEYGNALRDLVNEKTNLNYRNQPLRTELGTRMVRKANYLKNVAQTELKK